MMKESGNSAQKLAMCRILSTAKPFELLASKIAQFRRHSRGIFGGESRAVPRALEAMPLQHLQAAARVQFGQGAIHVSPCERLQPAARVQFSIGIPQGLPHECFGAADPPILRRRIFVVAAPPHRDLRVESHYHVAKGSATRVARGMLTTSRTPAARPLPVVR
jgi:hypothetical protein